MQEARSLPPVRGLGHLGYVVVTRNGLNDPFNEEARVSHAIEVLMQRTVCVVHRETSPFPL